jgi:diketogulonate reductase-like aldo/keto reductase|eukprot:TRINITY_DN21268_c0_g1_i1.p1 TRINITY_DN21268_c0_g1~~TRINITY_DN21268_c0_g1_i1.p1  ORF type:complete len:310 (-),score=34.51 TRINITY_DN21268_c0_g1_i1:257-1141(-)
MATETVELIDGQRMPLFGLGVYRTRPGSETYNSVRGALDLGYRLVDSAAMYKNERSVGEAIRDSGVPREEIWVTTKLNEPDHGYEETLMAFRASLKELALDYIDLYLVHSPFQGKLVETWDAMIELQKQGLIRSIGVSNYNVSHIEVLRANGRPLPAVNQIEMHPMIFAERQPIIQYCRKNRILIQAYGSVFSGHQNLLESRPVQAVTQRHGKTPAQVLLRWGLQQGFAVIPKSVRKERLEENMNLFDFSLSDQDFKELTAMEGGKLREYWNPLNAKVDTGRVDIVSGGQKEQA